MSLNGYYTGVWKQNVNTVILKVFVILKRFEHQNNGLFFQWLEPI